VISIAARCFSPDAQQHRLKVLFTHRFEIVDLEKNRHRFALARTCRSATTQERKGIV